MFIETAETLLQGQFICESAYGELFRWLDGNPDNFNRVSNYVGQLNRVLVQTGNKSAYYLAHGSLSADRKECRLALAEVKKMGRPLTAFLNTVMQATSDESILIPGTVIRANQLMAAIDANANYRNDLQTVANLFEYAATRTNQRSMLDAILKYLVNHGYLVVEDKDQAIYRVTGRIDWFLEAIAFIDSNTRSVNVEEKEIEALYKNSDLFAEEYT